MTTNNDAVAAFWAWWAGARAQIEACIESGEWGELPQEISGRVHAIHPDLQWELGPGREGRRHHLCLSPMGNPILRVLTERWLRGSPEPDSVFEFYPARQPRRGLHLNLDGTEVAHEGFSVAFGVDMSRERVDVTLHHPSFSGLDEQTRGSIAFLMLDGWFGEDGVERWIGAVSFPQDAIDGDGTFEGLDAAVIDLQGVATGERYAVLQGEDEAGLPIFVSLNKAIKRVEHLLLDVHLEIVITMALANEHGLPPREEGEALGEMEQALLGALGEGAVYVGRETHKGKRIVHLHVAESSGALAAVEAWAALYPTRPVEVSAQADPQWAILGRWG